MLHNSDFASGISNDSFIALFSRILQEKMVETDF